MKTSTQYRGILLIALGSAIISGSAMAQDQNAYLYIAHAASGRVISSTTNPALPVDVSVNGICIAKGVPYGDIQGPFSGPAGTYTFLFKRANAAAACTGTAVFSASVALSPGKSYFGVLSVGATNQVTGMIFPVDLSAISSGAGRYEIVNATQQTLGATVSKTGFNGSVFVQPGTLQAGLLQPGIYSTSVINTAYAVVSGPMSAEIAQRNAYLYVIAGSAAKGSVQLIGPKVIAGVF